MKLLLALILTTGTYASAATYYCKSTMVDSTSEKQISVNAKTVKVSSIDVTEGGSFIAKRNLNYTPKGAPKVKYDGVQGKTRTEVVLSERMLSDAKSGYMDIRVYSSYGLEGESYKCTLAGKKKPMNACQKMHNRIEDECTRALCQEYTYEDAKCVMDGDFNVALQECISDEMDKAVTEYNKKNDTNLVCEENGNE